MARFWKRGTDRSIEQLLRASRPEPTDAFASSVLNQIADSPAPAAPRRAGSRRRLALALALTVVALSIAVVLGGISAASAGLGGIAHIATKAVTSSHTKTTSVTTSSSKKGDNNGDKDDQGGKNGDDPDGDADDKGSKGDDNDGDHDGDHHQYKVGVCHWANHKYVLIFVSPQGAANHLKNHPKDKLPVNGHC